MIIDKKYHVDKLSDYKELEAFIEEANNMDLDIISIVKEGLEYVVVYRSYNEVGYEIR